MKSFLFTSGLLLCLAGYTQNVGIGETAPTAKLEIKADGNAASTNSLLLRNSDNSRLLHMNGLGSATFGNTTFSAPGHIVGIHNGLQPTKAHLGLYATGSLANDAGAMTRLVFSNVNNGTRQYEIQSYSGTSLLDHSLSFRYLNLSTTPATETFLLYFSSNSNAFFSGNITASNFNVTSNGTEYDFLARGPSTGLITAKKGTGALAINYIICTTGTYPSFGGTSPTDQPLTGEIRMWAGVTPPSGWAFCQGQLVSIASNTALFSIIGTLYGGNGSTNFALPDLRGATPVQQGSPVNGRSWSQGERSF